MRKDCRVLLDIRFQRLSRALGPSLRNVDGARVHNRGFDVSFPVVDYPRAIIFLWDVVRHAQSMNKMSEYDIKCGFQLEGKFEFLIMYSDDRTCVLCDGLYGILLLSRHPSQRQRPSEDRRSQQSSTCQ